MTSPAAAADAATDVRSSTVRARWVPPTRRPVILYELNEVPWRVIDWYTARRPRSELAGILPRAATFTTLTRDEGELHPWCTWPTLHRGVYSTKHNIRFINQDKQCADQYPPIWETAALAGRAVGVFGSLQSYPVPATPAYAFYVPDTFAPGPETYPPRYTPFQHFNLRQTRADGAVAQDISLDGSVVRDLIAFPSMGVRPRTFGALAYQLLREKFSPSHKVRRPLLQPVLAFDVFVHAFQRHRPEFCTFFTNHVASVMHRYWKYTFPEDFDFTAATRLDAFHADNILVAMDIADRQLGTLRRDVEKSGGQLVIASSMGQEAIQRPEYHGELRISDFRALARAVGFDKPLRDLLAMQPDFNLGFDCEADRIDFSERIARLVSASGECIWYNIVSAGSTLNLALSSATDILHSEVLYLAHENGSREPVTLERAGMRKIFRDDGTGYHQPRGMLIWFQRELAPLDSREEIELTEVRRMLLEALDIAA